MWYYMNGSHQQVGPVDEAEFEALARSGTIRPDTYVWKEGLAQWIDYSEAMKAAGGIRCSECGNTFSQNDVINLSGSWVCANCKPLRVQKLREGVPFGTFLGGWRSGKRLVTPVEATLPKRCVKCNEPTDDPQIKRKLSWHSPAIFLLIIVGLLVYVIVALCCQKRATVFISVCPRHRSARRMAITMAWLMILGGIAAIVGGACMEGTQYDAYFGWMILGGVLLLITGIIYGLVRGRLVYATKITKDNAWIGGCGSEFLAEFPEWTG